MNIRNIVDIEANKENDKATFNAFSNLKFTTQQLEVIGDHAFGVWTWEAVHTGVSPSLGIEPTGKPVYVEGCDVLQWENDKITEIKRYHPQCELFITIEHISYPRTTCKDNHLTIIAHGHREYITCVDDGSNLLSPLIPDLYVAIFDKRDLDHADGQRQHAGRWYCC